MTDENAKNDEGKKENVKVAIYTTPTCGYCKMAKQFFEEHNIGYEEYDVAKDQAKAEEMTAKSGQMGVPVITVTKQGEGVENDEEVIIGFDQERLKQALGIS